MLQGLGTGKMHKVIKMTFWANLPIHCRNHTVLIISPMLREALLINMKGSYGQYSYVQTMS